MVLKADVLTCVGGAVANVSMFVATVFDYNVNLFSSNIGMFYLCFWFICMIRFVLFVLPVHHNNFLRTFL